LFHDDPVYAKRAAQWSAKLRDIHEWLAEIGIRVPVAQVPQTVTYHEACHLCHGQKITHQPREVLAAIPRPEFGGTSRIDVVLRQRRHLQHHPAGDVAEAACTQDKQHRKNRRGSRGVGKPRLLTPVAALATPGEQGLENSSPHFAVGGGLSGRSKVKSLTESPYEYPPIRF
jgi:hypothetical protein